MCRNGVNTQCKSDIGLEEVAKSTSALSDEAKKLPKTRVCQDTTR